MSKRQMCGLCPVPCFCLDCHESLTAKARKVATPLSLSGGSSGKPDGWLPEFQPKVAVATPEKQVEFALDKLNIAQLKMLMKVYGVTATGGRKEIFVDRLVSVGVSLDEAIHAKRLRPKANGDLDPKMVQEVLAAEEGAVEKTSFQPHGFIGDGLAFAHDPIQAFEELSQAVCDPPLVAAPAAAAPASASATASQSESCVATAAAESESCVATAAAESERHIIDCGDTTDEEP